MDITRKTMNGTHYIYVERTCPYTEIAQAMESGFGEVFGFLGAEGIQPTSMPLSLYPTMPQGDIHFHAGVMVSAEDAAKVTGDIQAGQLPKGDVMTTTHVGPYDKMNESHQALWKHMEDNDIPSAMPVWEVYVDDPGQTAPEDLRTQLFRTVG